MKSWKKPTPEQVDRAIALLVRVEQYRYFFDHLENPEWIPFLRSKGFFKSPPNIQRDEKKGTIKFPPWPESRYLARMASKAPEQVLEVLLQIPETDNISIHEDFIDAFLRMPPNLTKLIEPVKKEIKWLSQQNHLYFPLPEKLGALIVHLAKGGEVDTAIKLARSLLEIFPESKESPHRLEARFDSWDYEDILKKYIPELANTTPWQTLELLCNLLETAIRLSHPDLEENNPEDFSYIWRPAIEDHEQNRSFGDFKDLFVTAVRNVAKQIVSEKLIQPSDVVNYLEKRPFKVFKRIALYLLWHFGEISQIEVCLTDKSLFEDLSFRHEYALLARDYFKKVSQEAQQKILSWIEKGPDLANFEKRWKERHKKSPTQKDKERYLEHWQRDRLALMKASLSPKWKAFYDSLVAKYGEPEHPDFASYSVSWVGPASPKTQEELLQMSIDEIVAFLKSWTPSVTDGFAPTPSKEGLGRILSKIVSEKPTQFAEKALAFKDLDPTYIRHLLSGLNEAVKANKTFDWKPVISLCQWVVTLSREIPERVSEMMDQDPHWGWARKEIAHLLESGFKKAETEISFELRNEVWAILEPLTDDPEPTPEYENKSSMKPINLSINTVRGQAIHTVIQYALWCRRNFQKLPNGEEKVLGGFKKMPEVREVLEKHLNPEVDSSLTIRSVYGQKFPLLVFLDEKWAKSHVSKIFPSEKDNHIFWEVAWGAYIAFWRPYDEVFEILYKEYEKAVNKIGTWDSKKLHPPHIDEALAKHLMTFYWRGKIAIDDPIFKTFWDKTSEEVSAYAIKLIGRSLKRTEGEVSSVILERLKALWEVRLQIAKESEHPEKYKKEIASFGWWFISDKFDEKWVIGQLFEALKFSSSIDPDYLVIEKLAVLASNYPKESILCLNIMVEGDQEGWKVYRWRGQLKKLLLTVLKSHDPEAQELAKSLINKLLAKGHLEFRKFLN